MPAAEAALVAPSANFFPGKLPPSRGLSSRPSGMGMPGTARRGVRAPPGHELGLLDNGERSLRFGCR